MKKILLIGCGHMGSALLSSWAGTNKYLITVVDPLKKDILTKKYKNKKIKIFKSILSTDKSIKYDFIIFATKPIQLKDAIVDLKKIRIDNTISIISIIAGKKINIFQKNFKNAKNIFRVMPNIPALIGQSMNCVVSNKDASKIKKKEVLKLFSLSGKTIFLDNENQIDMTTAISGSGPGFIFNLIDATEKAAIKLGFKKETAKILVAQTFKGSINLYLENKLSAKDLVNTVATKGGTTEAGLKVMNKNKIHKVFVDVANASYKKSKQQGK